MTPTPADKPDKASAVEPGVIDLEELGQRYVIGDKATKTILFSRLLAAVEALRKRIATDGLPCVCRFHSVESATRQGSETGVLVDPHDPIRECDVHKALRERVAELEATVGHIREANEHWHTRVSSLKTEVEAGEQMHRAWHDRALAAEARGVELAGALERAKEAMDTWVCMFAPELCDAAHVEQAKARIRGVGTLAYIAEINKKVIDAMIATPAEALERARGEDYAAGLEAAAKWHDSRVQKIHPSNDGPTRTCHVESAKAIRALGKE